MILIDTAVPADRIEATRRRVERFAKRAQAKGLPIPTLEVGESKNTIIGYTPTFNADGNPKPIYGKLTEIRLVADAPLAAGAWRVHSAVEQVLMPDRTTAPVRRKIDLDAEALPDAILDLSPTDCQQCGLKRRRKMTMIVVAEGAEPFQRTYKQVGTECVKDLTGHDPADLVAYVNRVREFEWDDEEGFASSLPRWFAPKDIVALAAEVASIDGYVSKRMAQEKGLDPSLTTGFTVTRLLQGDKDEQDRLERKARDGEGSGARIEQLVKATTAALDELPAYPASEYEQTLRTLWAAELIPAKHVNFMASAISQGYRRIEREAKQAKAAAEAPSSVHLGSVGDRLRDLDAKVTLVRVFEAEWPKETRYLVKLRTSDADLIWWTGNAHGVQAGDDVTLTATVKRHEMDKLTGLPVTVVTRAMIGATA